ncbi:MAG: hypothetical protein ABFR32_10375 [Bacteroidota bacterium]
MKTIKYNIIWIILLSTSVVFGQKQTKKFNESFKVNKDVLVEIDSRHSDVLVETWNKNIVSIEGLWEVEGMTKEEATKYFEGWDFEALGNKEKVVINSRSSSNYYSHYDVFDNMEFDFDFDSISYLGELFNGNYYSELPPLPSMSPLPPMPPMPPFRMPAIEHLPKIGFDYEAYQKNEESYMKEFKIQQEAWKKEFKEKYEPQMKAYEKKMEQWEKKVEPQMKAYEKKMEQWEKKVEPQLKAYEKKMEAQAKKMEMKMRKMEYEIQEKYAQKLKVKEAKISKYKIKKSLVIKVPKGAKLKVGKHYGKITLPNDIKILN